MNEWGLALQRNTSHFKMAARRKINDQNKSLSMKYNYIENYQIWASDIDTSWEKLLFEINIVGQPRFPLNLKLIIKGEQQSNSVK